MFMNMNSELFYTCTTALLRFWFSYYKKKNRLRISLVPRFNMPLRSLRGAIGDNNTFT